MFFPASNMYQALYSTGPSQCSSPEGANNIENNVNNAIWKCAIRFSRFQMLIFDPNNNAMRLMLLVPF